MRFIYYVVIGLVLLALFGCATSTPLTSLEKQVRYEQRAESCRNAGGVWYEWSNLNGRCDWRGHQF